MAAESPTHLELEIGHVLFMDVVGYSKLLFTVGVNDIFGEDPPSEIGFEHGSALGYAGFLYDNLGRFVYVELRKRF